MKKTAAVVFSFNRPQYLKPVWESIKAANQLFPVDIHAFQDGITNKITGKSYAKEDEVKACIDILQADKDLLSSLTINEFNESIALQKDKANRLFEHYDQIFFFEEDMIISRYYFRLMDIALTQFPDNLIIFHNTVSSGSLQDIEYSGGARLWGYGMTKHLYSKIKPEWEYYANAMKSIDYNSRRAFSPRKLRNRYGLTSLLHDTTIQHLCRVHGKGKLMTTMSRGFYVGKIGNIAYNEELWNKRGMDNQSNVIEYPEDENLKEFILRN